MPEIPTPHIPEAPRTPEQRSIDTLTAAAAQAFNAQKGQPLPDWPPLAEGQERVWAPDGSLDRLDRTTSQDGAVEYSLTSLNPEVYRGSTVISWKEGGDSITHQNKSELTDPEPVEGAGKKQPEDVQARIETSFLAQAKRARKSRFARLIGNRSVKGQ